MSKLQKSRNKSKTKYKPGQHEDTGSRSNMRRRQGTIDRHRTDLRWENRQREGAENET